MKGLEGFASVDEAGFIGQTNARDVSSHPRIIFMESKAYDH